MSTPEAAYNEMIAEKAKIEEEKKKKRDAKLARRDEINKLLGTKESELNRTNDYVNKATDLLSEKPDATDKMKQNESVLRSSVVQGAEEWTKLREELATIESDPAIIQYLAEQKQHSQVVAEHKAKIEKDLAEKVAAQEKVVEDKERAAMETAKQLCDVWQEDDAALMLMPVEEERYNYLSHPYWEGVEERYIDIQNKINVLNAEKSKASGFFKGSKLKKIDAQLDELDTQWSNNKSLYGQKFAIADQRQKRKGVLYDKLMGGLSSRDEKAAPDGSLRAYLDAFTALEGLKGRDVRNITAIKLLADLTKNQNKFPFLIVYEGRVAVNYNKLFEQFGYNRQDSLDKLKQKQG